MENDFKITEINNISLLPGDILIVKCRGSNFSDEFLQSFGSHLKDQFPVNKIELLLLEDNHDIVFERIQTLKQKPKCVGCACSEGEQCD